MIDESAIVSEILTRAKYFSALGRYSLSRAKILRPGLGKATQIPIVADLRQFDHAGKEFISKDSVISFHRKSAYCIKRDESLFRKGS